MHSCLTRLIDGRHCPDLFSIPVDREVSICSSRHRCQRCAPPALHCYKKVPKASLCLFHGNSGPRLMWRLDGKIHLMDCPEL